MKRAAVENLIRRLRDEVDDEHWDMSHWLSGISRMPDGAFNRHFPITYRDDDDIPHCQTAGCMAGTVFLGLTPEQRVMYQKEYGELDNGFVRYCAMQELGLSSSEAHILFEPFASISDFERATRQRVIQLLENLLDTGVIDWSTVVPDVSYVPQRLEVELTD